MGRKRRPYLPGAVFHLTARTHGREPWFTPTVRDRVVHYAASAIGASDARLLAYCIMPNHLHLVLRQGQLPLGRVMQPLLRRIALLVQRSLGREGHVFERRFNHRWCPDPDYVRNAVVYTHLNPVRAGLVDEPGTYPWSSHSLYVRGEAVSGHAAPALAADDALRLFAPREDTALEGLRTAYARFVDWRIECDRHQAAEVRGETVGPAPPPPPVFGGDLCWSRALAPLFRDASGPASSGHLDAGARFADIAEIALQTLAERAPHLHLDDVRSSYKGRAAVRVRRAIIRRLNAAGHPGTAIACYLRVSVQCVSAILRAERKSRS